jgi:predicted phage-related endonuclease
VQQRKAPPPDGSQSAQRALQALFPRDDGLTLDWTQDTEMGSAFSDLQAIRQRIKTFELEEARLRQRIEQRMGPACRALFETGEITLRKSKDSVVLDTQRLLLERPELKERYALVRAGSRRFVLRGQGVEDNLN